MLGHPNSTFLYLSLSPLKKAHSSVFFESYACPRFSNSPRIQAITWFNSPFIFFSFNSISLLENFNVAMFQQMQIQNGVVFLFTYRANVIELLVLGSDCLIFNGTSKYLIFFTILCYLFLPLLHSARMNLNQTSLGCCSRIFSGKPSPNHHPLSFPYP